LETRNLTDLEYAFTLQESLRSLEEYKMPFERGLTTLEWVRDGLTKVPLQAWKNYSEDKDAEKLGKTFSDEFKANAYGFLENHAGSFGIDRTIIKNVLEDFFEGLTAFYAQNAEKAPQEELMAYMVIQK